VLNGDSVTLVISNATAYFGDKALGSNKPVTVSGLALSSGAGTNYTVTDPSDVTVTSCRRG